MKKLSLNLGFTLVELLVVVAIIGVLSSFVIVSINPYKQIQKAQDAQRVQDFKQIQSALDTYYNDNNCYPAVATLHFGSSFQVGSTIYMKEVPQDPLCPTGGSCYVYTNDNSTCPQWNVLFSKHGGSSSREISCPLSQITNCLPKDWDTSGHSGYNACSVSGKVDCSYINSININH